MMSRGVRTGQESRSVSFDLVLGILLGVWMITVGLGYWSDMFGRAVLGIIAILIAPGWMLVAALLPSAGSRAFSSWSTGGPERVQVSSIERGVLAVGMSLCLVPLIGMAVHFSPATIRPGTFLGAIGGATAVLGLLAVFRRLQLQPRERYTIGGPGSLIGEIERLQTPGTNPAIAILLVVGFLFAGGGIGYAVWAAEPGEPHTAFHLTTEDPDTGEFVAAGYPSEVTEGGEATVTVGITNAEDRPIEYTVIVLLQSVSADREPFTEEELDRFEVPLEQGNSWTAQHSVEPSVTGDELRVTYLLYDDAPVDEPGTENAYRSAHYWVDVEPAN